MSDVDDKMVNPSASTQLTIVIDISPNDRDRIATLKFTKLALKSLVKGRKLPDCADVRIVTCNRWVKQGVTNQDGVFHHPTDQSEILRDIQKIRGISIRKRNKQSALGLDGFSEVLQNISTGQRQPYSREVCVFIGNTSNHSEESSSSDTASASAAKLLQIAKMNAASVYILDVGAKEPLKERFLSAVAQASGGLYRSTTSNKVLELREKLQKIFEDIAHVNSLASHITDILEVETKKITLNELTRRFERCLPTENTELLVTHPSEDLKHIEDVWRRLAWQDFSSVLEISEQLSNMNIDSHEDQSIIERSLQENTRFRIERALVAAVRQWNIQPSEAMELADGVPDEGLLFAIRRPRQAWQASENEDSTRFLVSYQSDNGDVLFQRV